MEEDDHVHTEEEVELDEIRQWLIYGMERGWIGPPMCHEHESRPPDNPDPMTMGCSVYVRCYKTLEEQQWVESQHWHSNEFKRRFRLDPGDHGLEPPPITPFRPTLPHMRNDTNG